MSVGQQHMGGQLAATPSPVSPPYSHHHHHQHLSHSTTMASHQQNQALHQVLSGRIGLGSNKRNSDGRNSSDCNDNLTGSGLVDSSYSGISQTHPHITSVSNAKKGRRAGGLMMDHVSSGSHHHLKSSVDGNSSCRSTPLTPLSSKSGGSQDGSSSPGNGASPLFHQQSSSFRTPSAMMSGMMVAGSSVNDPTSVSAYHQTAPTAYYQQPYYHHLYPTPHHQPHHHHHPGYYQTSHHHHQGWTTDFTAGLHHHHHPGASVVPSVPMALPPSAVNHATTITPVVAATPYQHSFPLTPDGSCGNPAGTTTGENVTGTTGVTASIYETNNGSNALQSNKGNNKDAMRSEDHNQQQQQDSYTAIQTDGVAGVGNGQGLIQQQSESGDHSAPSYYTKYEMNKFFECKWT